MKQCLLIFLGGGLGASFRFLMVQVACKLCGAGFPIGILGVNAVGCFLMGIAVMMFQTYTAHALWHSFVIIGVLGGFTTFSSFTYDYWHLFQRGDFAWGAFYLVGSIVLSSILLISGMKVARLIVA